MASRAIWKGSISFGLVEIPVALVTAEKSEEEIHFSMLDKRDFSPVGYKRVSKETGREVPWEEIVKGYEYEPDEYVVMTDADFQKANPEAARSIEIFGFVDMAKIDPVYFETPYYLEPVRKNSKGYALLRETLKRTGKAGIAKVVLRSRQRLGAVVPRGPVLTLELLRYAHELKTPDEVSAPEEGLKHAGLSRKEVDMAEQVVEGMSAEWDPASYRDDYHDDLMALIRRKIDSGQTHVIEEPAREPRRRRGGEVVDLMPLLKQSVEHVRSRSDGHAPRRKAKPSRASTARAARRNGAAKGRRHRNA